MIRQKWLLAGVGGHLLLTVLHGVVHAAVPLYPSGWNAAITAIALYLLPVLGAGLVLGGYRRAGATLLLGAGVASFAFEGAFHFFVANPDHVAHVPNHRTSFGLTAVLTTVGDFLLVGGAWASMQVSSQSGNVGNATVES